MQDAIIKYVLKMLSSIPWEAVTSYLLKRLAIATTVMVDRWLEIKEKQAAKTETVVDDELVKAGQDANERLQEFLEKM